MILIIENDDSFSYNVYQSIGKICDDVRVISGLSHTLSEIKTLQPTHIVFLSSESPFCEEVFTYYKTQIPLLGIGKGMDFFASTFCCSFIPTSKPTHGKKITIHIANGNPIFYDLSPVLDVGCYHRTYVDKTSLPEDLLIIAEDTLGNLMGIKHRDHEIYGLLFHPESFLTENNDKIFRNFLALKGE